MEQQVEYPPVLTKRDFVSRFALGEFGNRGPMWNTVDQFLSGVDSLNSPATLYHLRNRVAGGPTFYNVRGDYFDLAFHKALQQGVKESDLYVAEMAPTKETVIQGEVMQTERGLYLFYSYVRKPMRDALTERSAEATGLLAKSLLETYLDPGSYEWINVLLERYPQHVVEFSAYNRYWGTIPNRNTVIWEVRMY